MVESSSAMLQGGSKEFVYGQSVAVIIRNCNYKETREWLKGRCKKTILDLDPDHSNKEVTRMYNFFREQLFATVFVLELTPKDEEERKQEEPPY